MSLELGPEWGPFNAKLWLHSKFDGNLDLVIVAEVKNKRYRFNKTLTADKQYLDHDIEQAKQKLFKKLVELNDSIQ